METAAGLALSAAASAAASLIAWASASAAARRCRRRPPRVGCWPIVGSVPLLREPWYLDLHERFGHQPVVTVRFGLQDVHVFNQWPAFKEAMVDNGEKLAGRLSQAATAAIFGDVGGIVSSDGELWRQYRRFTLRTLRDFGLGRKGGEELVAAEAEQLCREVDAADGAALETSALLSTATSNVICQLVFGSRVASEDPRFGDILRLFRRITQSGDSNRTNSALLSVAKFAERLPFQRLLFAAAPGVGKLLRDFAQLMQFCSEHRDRRAAEMQDGVHAAADYIEAHLLHQRSEPGVFNDTRLALAVADLFIAGTDTTSHSLRWAILFMIANPTVADKVHREIVDAVGREKLPTMADKSKLQFTQATIEETLRRSSLVALGIFHRVTDDVRVGEFQLEKDSLCTFNVYAIHHDRRVFADPQEFRPERHLDAGGHFVGCSFQSAFGLGKRACLGESLARMELLIFFSCLMQRYSFALDPRETRSLWDLTENPEFSRGTALRAPPMHKIIFSRR